MNKKMAHQVLLLKRLAIVYFIFSICRFIFFLYNNGSFQQDTFSSVLYAFIIGLRFDTSAIMYVFGLIILMHTIPLNIRNKDWYQKVLRVLFFICLFVCVLLNLVDAGYFVFSGRRSGVELITMQSAQNLSPLVYIYDYWHLSLLLVGLIFLAWKLYPEFKRKVFINTSGEFFLQAIVFIFFAGIILMGGRGSFGLKPLNTLDAARLTSSQLMPLTLNTPFQFLLTFEQVGLQYKTYMSNEEAYNIFNPDKKVADTTGTKQKNVVIIIVESLGKEYVGYYNNGIGYTPFIDSLMHLSTVYNHAYANGKKSIEGIPAIISALPSWMPDDFMNSIYKSNKLPSIGYYLKKQGYDASFYHGGKNGTMSFDQLIANTNAGKYYGLNEYPDKKDFDGNWGIYDEPYLSYFATELGEKKEPFFSTVFTLSSHHPYKLPKQYEKKFAGGSLPIHATIQYVDFALKQFFEKIRSMPWYQNTLFVVTADHSSENERPFYRSSVGKYAIPLFIFDPGNQHKSEVYNTVSQLNITDEVLNRVLAEGEQYFSFASNMAMQYDNGIYQVIQYPFVLKFDGEKAIELYNLPKDSMLQYNLVKDPVFRTKKDSLVKKAEAVIQIYNKRLIDNKAY